VVEQSKVVTEGTVNAAGIESMAEHSALVLVSATSRVTNSAGAKDEPRQWRLRVTVTEDGGQYKMSKVEFVP
jgi:Mce-associated membrane protein